MKCDLCGYEFTKDEAIETCSGCPMSHCGMFRCPNCGYEYVPEPQILKFFKNKILNKRRDKDENK